MTNMKQTYVKPEALPMQMELQEIMALSLSEKEADPDGEVLTRRSDWEEEEKGDLVW